MKTLFALAALGGGLCLVTPAFAEPVTRVVSAAGLDLETASGRHSLDRRMDIAAKAACGDASSADARGWKALKACRADALARATPQRDQILAERRTTERLAAK